MLKKVSLVFLISVVAYFCICWVRATRSFYLTSYTFTLCYFALTYACLEKLKFQDRMNNIYVCIAIILGFTLVELPIRIMDFGGTIESLIITLFTVISVLLSLICWIEKRFMTTFLALVIIVLLNTCALSQWLEYIGCEIK